MKIEEIEAYATASTRIMELQSKRQTGTVHWLQFGAEPDAGASGRQALKGSSRRE
jgi:hypothetical protein